MVIAEFASGSTLSGKKITFEDGRLSLEGAVDLSLRRRCWSSTPRAS